jgi:hypothetical protein
MRRWPFSRIELKDHLLSWSTAFDPGVIHKTRPRLSVLPEGAAPGPPTLVRRVLDALVSDIGQCDGDGFAVIVIAVALVLAAALVLSCSAGADMISLRIARAAALDRLPPIPP